MADIIHKVVRPDGRIEYTDTPGSSGKVSPYRSGMGAREGDEAPKEETKPYDPKLAEKLIKEAQKRIPKISDYLDYADFLRNYKPWGFERVMKDLERTSPQTWMKLQKYPQFKPLRETAIGLKAGEKNLSAVIGLASGSMTGSAEKWMETTLKDMMKKEGWGPYADVLGSKATTLATPTPAYSTSRLGQHLKVEDARAAAAAKAAAKDLEAAQGGLRAARGAGVVRSVGPLVDLGIGALNPDFFRGISAVRAMHIGKKLVDAGVLTIEEAYELRSLMANAEFDKAQALIEAGVQRKSGAR
jgi:hypothetical protein